MRADRLVAIVLLLQAHGQVTAARLAELLETSERTIRRDLEALCVAGVPVYSQRGRHGGWTLLGGHRLDLTGFTVEEARALFQVGGIDSPGLRSALPKVFAALPEPLREQAREATRTTVVDPAGWGRRPDEARFVDELRDAVMARVQVDIDYAKPGGVAESRRVHPYGLVSKGGVWYLLAGTPKGRRTFRVSRIERVRRTGIAAEIPDGLDLAGEWESAQRDFEVRMRVVQVVVDVAEKWVLAFSAAMGGWTDVHEEPGSSVGWRRFTVSVPHPRAAAIHLAPFGGDVRVVSPEEVRTELARLGAALVATNSPPSAIP